MKRLVPLTALFGGLVALFLAPALANAASPSLSISDASVTEGNVGASNSASFRVTLTKPPKKHGK